jgi:hypothetical protein
MCCYFHICAQSKQEGWHSAAAMLESFDMLPRNLASLIATLLLVSCSSTPEQAPQSAEDDPVPEITLNLPQGDCRCKQEKRDYTFLEKGFNSLEVGEYLEAMGYFQRYQRIENTTTANTESRIAIAYLSMLPDSPTFDREEAVSSYARVRSTGEANVKLHSKVLILRESLETFFAMEQQIEQLKSGKSELREELKQRGAAIKRLRDLTLGREPEAGGILGK